MLVARFSLLQNTMDLRARSCDVSIYYVIHPNIVKSHESKNLFKTLKLKLPTSLIPRYILDNDQTKAALSCSGVDKVSSNNGWLIAAYYSVLSWSILKILKLHKFNKWHMSGTLAIEGCGGGSTRFSISQCVRLWSFVDMYNVEWWLAEEGSEKNYPLFACLFLNPFPTIKSGQME